MAIIDHNLTKGIFGTGAARILSILSRVLLLFLPSMPMECGAAERLDPSGFVHTDGKRLTMANGNTYFVKGINLGHWLVPEGYMFHFGRRSEAPDHIRRVFERMLGRERAAQFWTSFYENFITEQDIRFIASVGFNTVRVPLDYRMFVKSEGEPRFEGIGYALLDRLMGWARTAGIRVILDLHAAPGGQVGASHDGGPGYPLLFYVAAHRDLTVRLWQTLAFRYRDEPTVLGYDLLNEPIAPHHDTKYLEPRLEPFLHRITTIFLTGSRWGTALHPLGAPFADNLVYTYHSYWASPRRNTIQAPLNFRDRYNVPMLITETGEGDDAWIAEFRKLHELHDIGWIFWTYKNLQQTTTVASISLPKDWPAVVDTAERMVEDDNAPLPPQAAIDRAFDDYLKGIALENCLIRWSYLAALGLKAHASVR